ncbi:hypothetical protein FXN63_09710 [Pigmentiphaga aceris]|uniref:Uncharacterized protein n=1 Tax=Pigmentiphaga aceris TaxID=1940612 RepID=A0A5C0AZS2_9BURK|nr:hypothetical protein [Pigmentiphaga aceris]QEI06081.1 hypothetical protein FXN63_09710 [Pigmentiphaga aceris]
MPDEDSDSPYGDGLVVRIYARITGGGYRGAVGIRRATDDDTLELACELPEIFSRSELACQAAAEFLGRASISGVLLHMLESWEGVDPGAIRSP